MSKIIGMEDLVANALIEIMEKDQTSKKVKFKTLMNYGTVVIKIYKKLTNDTAVLLVSRDYKNEMLSNYAEYFEVVVDEDEDECIQLKEGVTLNDLKDSFRYYLSVDMLLALLDQESLKELVLAA